MADAAYALMDADEFLRWAEGREGRFELVEGVAFAMAGAQRRHDRVVVNCIVSLANQLRGKPCQPGTSDSAIRVSKRTIRRPDVVVDCGTPADDALEADQPVLAIEVLSPSTRQTDLVRKLNEYQSVETLRYILLLEPDMPTGVFYHREPGGAWKAEDPEGLEAVVEMPAIEATLRFADLYEGVELTPLER